LKLQDSLALQKHITEQCSKEFEKVLENSQQKINENMELTRVKVILTAKINSLNDEITKLKCMNNNNTGNNSNNNNNNNKVCDAVGV